MTDEESSNSLLVQLKKSTNKWRLAFLCFVIAYAITLIINLTNQPIQWDEVAHLNGGSFLYWANYEKFMANSFYPPLLDFLTYLSFKVLGVSLFAARLIPVLFSMLALWTVFELACRMYDGKTGLLAAVLLGVMPGYYWLSSLALLETMLVFFTAAAVLFFYLWLTSHKDRYMLFTGLAMGFGLMTKYQMIVTAIVIIVGILFLARKQLKFAFKKFILIVAAAAAIVVPWIIVAYEVYADKLLSQWIYALQVGNPERSIYSGRFPAPIFYLIEMVWPYDVFHPVSIFVYAAGLAGLVFLVWRRRPQDKIVFIWFACIFVFFTLITNKEWRYVLPLFPALAIAASAGFMSAYEGLSSAAKKAAAVANKRRLLKAASVLLVASMAGAVAYSVYDTCFYVSALQINIPIEQATNYAYQNIGANKSIIVLCPFNLFSRDMVRFYLWADGDNLIPVFQYPRQPVDAYTPNFNITEFISICKQLNVQYVFTYENGGTVPYYNTTLNLQQIYMQLYASGNFTHISDNATFGANPRRIFILEYIGNLQNRTPAG
jgi:4-amino-4-deoxy-L-arabinose transferase-like glycosyltransferase